MTTSDWLMIFAIIIAIIQIPMMFVSGIVAVLVQKWITQPKPSPVENQPKSWKRRITDWFIKTAPWGSLVYLVAIAINMYLLISALLDPKSLTRSDVFLIAFTTSLIFFNVCMLYVNFLFLSTLRIQKSLDDLLEVEIKIIDIINTLNDINKMQNDRFDGLVKQVPPLPSTPVEKMLSAVKELLKLE